VTPRWALPEEAPRLAEIARAAYAPYVPLIGREPPPMLQDFPADIAAGHVLVMGRPAQGYAVSRAVPQGWLLENVAVAPDAQGSGIGRALIAAVEDLARHAGQTRVVLYTNAAMTGNLALYPALGYREVERRIEHGLNRVYFEKDLAEP